MLWQDVFWTVALHDLGKANSDFQKKIRLKSQYEDLKLDKNLFKAQLKQLAEEIAKLHKRESHPLISSFFATKLPVSKLFYGHYRGIALPINIPSLVIGVHHSHLTPAKYMEFNAKRAQILEDSVKRIWSEVIAPTFGEQFSEACPSDLPITQSYEEILNTWKQNIILLQNLENRAGGSEKLKIYFAFLKSMLHYADWLASQKESGDSEEYVYTPNEECVSQGVRKEIESKSGAFTLNTHQIIAQRFDGDAYLEAPTGTGKTEAAVLWALRNMNGRKLIYLLPTMTTANKMRSRLQRMLGVNVGLIHGTAVYSLLKEVDYSDSWEFRRAVLFSKGFLHPANVGTVDQLLWLLFNWGKWDLKFTNGANAAIIFDEIHAYEPWTLALIIECAKRLKELGAILLFMSATFPSVLEKILEDKLGVKPIKFLPEKQWQKPRIEINSIDSSICGESVIQQIIRDYQRHLKVLVICNTIGTAKTVYSEISKHTPFHDRILFHSQFILVDREKREELLEKSLPSGFVAVTTQVVEVSLDIDFDTLYTELCPLDALVQRLGRVNRLGIKPQAPVYVCKPNGKSFFIYEKKFVDRTAAVLQDSPKKFKEGFDVVYPEEEYMQEFSKAYSQATALAKSIINELSGIFDLSVEEKNLQRLAVREGYISIEGIPECFLDEIEKLDTPIKRMRYTVRVPLFKKHIRLLNFGKDFTIIHSGYDDDLGLDLSGEQDFIF
jgi:CRISPR-associated endonuclease/helicase Cas3